MALFLSISSVFMKTQSIMMPTTGITTQQWVSHTAPTLTVLVKKYTPCQGVVWSQYSLPGTFYVPLGFGVILFAKVCFFLPVQF